MSFKIFITGEYPAQPDDLINTDSLAGLLREILEAYCDLRSNVTIITGIKTNFERLMAMEAYRLQDELPMLLFELIVTKEEMQEYYHNFDNNEIKDLPDQYIGISMASEIHEIDSEKKRFDFYEKLLHDVDGFVYFPDWEGIDKRFKELIISAKKRLTVKDINILKY